MQTLWTLLILLFSSGYVLALDYFASSSRGLQKAIIFPLLLLIFIFYRAYTTSWKTALQHNGKLFLILAGTIVVQMLVVATGGLHSPFLILIHLAMIGMSFFIGFGVSVLFLFLSFIVILGDITISNNLVTFFTTNPSNVILQIVSLFSIIPIAYIISQQYHVKEMLSTILQEKVIKDEKIIESLQELIVVTDADLTILSINDAVERTLQKPRSELLHTPLFNAFLLKDETGKLVKKEMLLDKDNKPLPTTSQFTIINAPKETQKVAVQIQEIDSMQSNKKQLSFIFSSSKETDNDTTVTNTVEKARTKYEAMLQALKSILGTNNNPAYNPLLSIENIGNDLYNVQSLQSTPYQKSESNIDIAVLCRKLVDLENEFGKHFNVTLSFLIENFGQKDVKQLTGENFQIDPEKFTGPFFTLLCDAKNCEIVMKKLLDLSVYLASSRPTAQIFASITREDKNIIIRVKVPNPNLTKEDLASLFVPNYALLPIKTNILAGSGLEGYLIQTLCEKMQTPIRVDLDQKDANYLVFTWILEKFEVKSKQAQ